MIEVEEVSPGKKDFTTFVYGDPIEKLREQIWECLTRYNLARSEPWFVIGDLDEITRNYEKEGGSLRSVNSFISFNDMIRNSDLLEFPAPGNKIHGRDEEKKEKGG